MEHDELTPLLQRFDVEVVDRSRQISREVIGYCMTTVIQPIVSALGRADARFKCYVPLPTAHYLEAIRVSAAEEYELVVVMDSLVSTKTFIDLAETNPSLAGYGEVMFTRSVATDVWAADLCLPLGHSGQGHCFLLSAIRIRQYFCKLVAMIAQDIFHTGNVQVSLKDPYTQVKISRQHEQFIFLLIPALYFHEAWPSCTWGFGLPEHLTSWLTPEVVSYCRQLGFFAVPLCCPFSKDEGLWRFSFVRAEKFLLQPEVGTDHQLYQHQQQQQQQPQPPHQIVPETLSPQRLRKLVERILKALRAADVNAFMPLSSYHLKTTVLHVCQQTPDAGAWTPDRLGERLLQVFRQLIVCLEKGVLPNFFIPACNLLAQYNLQELVATSQRLRDIHDELCKSPAASIRLQC